MEIVERKQQKLKQPIEQLKHHKQKSNQNGQQENRREQELDNGLKLVKTPDGQYNIMTEDRKMLMTKNNTREYTLGI